MRETEILRGLGKANCYANGVVPENDRPNKPFLRRIAEAMIAADEAIQNVPNAQQAVTKNSGLAGNAAKFLSGRKAAIDAATREYANGTAFAEGPGTGRSDSIPARISRGEAVLPAETVRKIGADTIADVIEATTGTPPARGLRRHDEYADGAVDETLKPFASRHTAYGRATMGTPPPQPEPATTIAAKGKAAAGGLWQGTKDFTTKSVSAIPKAMGAIGGIATAANAAGDIYKNGPTVDNSTDFAGGATLTAGSLASAPVAAAAGGFLTGKAIGSGVVDYIGDNTQWGRNLVDKFAGSSSIQLTPEAQKYAQRMQQPVKNTSSEMGGVINDNAITQPTAVPVTRPQSIRAANQDYIRPGEGYVTVSDPNSGRSTTTHIQPPEVQQAPAQGLREKLIDEMLHSRSHRDANRAQAALAALDNDSTQRYVSDNSLKAASSKTADPLKMSEEVRAEAEEQRKKISAQQKYLESIFRTKGANGEDVADTATIAEFNRKVDATIAANAKRDPSRWVNKTTNRTLSAHELDAEQQAELLNKYDMYRRMKQSVGWNSPGAEFVESDDLNEYDIVSSDGGLYNGYKTRNGSHGYNSDRMYDSGPASLLFPDWGKTKTDKYGVK